jgi:pyruvate/2-oxoglutarate dehydrogenase complex dihydrolipoamide acyltransferase (E2) component
MAERTMTVCDIDDRRGGTVVATASVRLELAGDVRELDVCDAHLAELRDAIAAVLPDRPTSGRRGRGRANATSRRRPSATATRTPRARRSAAAGDGTSNGRSLAFSNDVRQWAREQGIEVKDQGRMSKAVVEQYRSAHP